MANDRVLRKALVLATEKHKDQQYGSEPFIQHLILTAQILDMASARDDVVAAGYLHHILEKTATLYAEVEAVSEEVAGLVFEVTSTTENTYPMLHTTDAMLILYADRLATLAVIDKFSKTKQNEYLQRVRFWEGPKINE